LKGERSLYIFEQECFKTVPIFDGHKLNHGNHIVGPAMIEEETTAIFVSSSFNSVCDQFGSFVLYRKGREDLVASITKGEGNEQH
ncbi:MAG TPA: hypothetical protein QF900_06985, partial [Arenicellales bacterium]|nr:hypothetical protein [Arenicellales bacterium]